MYLLLINLEILVLTLIWFTLLSYCACICMLFSMFTQPITRQWWSKTYGMFTSDQYIICMLATVLVALLSRIEKLIRSILLWTVILYRGTVSNHYKILVKWYWYWWIAIPYICSNITQPLHSMLCYALMTIEICQLIFSHVALFAEPTCLTGTGGSYCRTLSYMLELIHGSLSITSYSACRRFLR